MSDPPWTGVLAFNLLAGAYPWIVENRAYELHSHCFVDRRFTRLVIALEAQRKRHLKLEQALVHTMVPARRLDMADRQCSLPVAYVVKRKKQKANPKAGQKGK